jgi:hypothetical protein
MEHCKTCKNWKRFSTEDEDGGECKSEKLTEPAGHDDETDMLVYSYDEGGVFWTGPDFGCVHHEET